MANNDLSLNLCVALTTCYVVTISDGAEVQEYILSTVVRTVTKRIVK